MRFFSGSVRSILRAGAVLVPAYTLDAANFVEMVQNRQGITISAPEEIAFINGWISKEGLLKLAEAYGKSPYGAHLKAVAEGKVKY